MAKKLLSYQIYAVRDLFQFFFDSSTFKPSPAGRNEMHFLVIVHHVTFHENTAFTCFQAGSFCGVSEVFSSAKYFQFSRPYRRGSVFARPRNRSSRSPAEIPLCTSLRISRRLFSRRLFFLCQRQKRQRFIFFAYFFDTYFI